MKITMYMGITGNGMIAKQNDDTSYISDEEWLAFENFAQTTGVMIIGWRNYEVMSAGKEFRNLKEVKVVVVSGSKKVGECITVESPKAAIELLEQEGIEAAMLSGGSKLNASFLKAGLVDEVILDVEPIIFSQGINLVDPGEYFETQLELLEVKNLSKNTVQLRYKVQK